MVELHLFSDINKDLGPKAKAMCLMGTLNPTHFIKLMRHICFKFYLYQLMISSFTESSRPGYNFRSVWHSDLARLYAHWKSGMDVGVGCQAVLVLACSCHW